MDKLPAAALKKVGSAIDHLAAEPVLQDVRN